MSAPHSSTAHVYVLKLAAPYAGPEDRLCGRIEHVRSGRRHDFDNAQALLDCLCHEERQVLREALPCLAPDPSPES